MGAFAGQSIQINRKCRGQRLTFTGAHFRNLVVVQDHTADQLNIKVTHSQNSEARFAHYRKSFGQKRVKSGSVCKTLAKFHSLRLQLLIRERLHFRLEFVNHRYFATVLTDQSIIAASKNLCQEIDHQFFSYKTKATGYRCCAHI